MFSFFKKNKKIKDNYVNAVSGAGGRGDKAQSGFWSYSTIAENYAQLERTYVESWAAAKIIDIPVDDMFIYERDISGLSDNDKEKLTEFNRELNIQFKIKQALKAARLYGTAFLVLISDDDLLETPLRVNSNINLTNILVVDRFRSVVLEWDKDITTPNFNEPLLYQFTIRNTVPFKVHHSRVIRVDGVRPLTSTRWESGYNWYWGVSELVKLMSTVTQEQDFANTTSYLLQESSIPILKVPDLQDALAGAPDAMGGSPSDTVRPLDRLVKGINDVKSAYRTMYLDTGMELDRLTVDFKQFPELFDRFHTRIAAAADIPQTRFFGKSPSGMNATGDSDAHNYAVMISSMQNKQLRPIYDKLDQIISSTINIDDFTYTFKPLVDISDSEQANIAYQKAQTDQIYLNNGVITEEEVRQSLVDDSTYDIDPDVPAPASVSQDIDA